MHARAHSCAGTLAVLVGNTRAFWAPFSAHVAEMHADDWNDHLRYPDPVNTYVENVVKEALAEAAIAPALEDSGSSFTRAGVRGASTSAERDGAASADVGAGRDADSRHSTSAQCAGDAPTASAPAGAPRVLEARFSHHPDTASFVHIQKACDVAGYAHLNTACHLNVHAVYGPWISLRCVVVFDVDIGDVITLPPNPPDSIPSRRAALEAKVAELVALGRRAGWKDWVDLRDLATTDEARQHRFPDEMIRYVNVDGSL
jgi:hypothetical protein